MHRHVHFVVAAAGAAALAFAAAPAAFAQEEEEVEFEVEDKVEIHISGSHWQACEVIENDAEMNYMRVKCKKYETPRVFRAAGTYMVRRHPDYVRPSKKKEALPEGAYKQE